MSSADEEKSVNNFNIKHTDTHTLLCGCKNTGGEWFQCQKDALNYRIATNWLQENCISLEPPLFSKQWFQWKSYLKCQILKVCDQLVVFWDVHMEGENSTIHWGEEVCSFFGINWSPEEGSPTCVGAMFFFLEKYEGCSSGKSILEDYPKLFLWS